MKTSTEHCRNPWNEKCRNTDIHIYIYYKGGKRPICRDCWNAVADKDLAW